MVREVGNFDEPIGLAGEASPDSLFWAGHLMTEQIVAMPHFAAQAQDSAATRRAAERARREMQRIQDALRVAEAARNQGQTGN